MATGPKSTVSSIVHVPICVPSAEQTVSPAVAHAAVELEGAETVCALLGEAAGGAADATEGETAGILDGVAGMLELSEGAAAIGDGAGVATCSCNGMVGSAAEGIGAAAEDEGCTTEDTLDCAAVPSLSPDPEPPGTVQPIGVHSIPCTLPLPFGAIVVNKSCRTSMLSNAQPIQVSVTVAVVSVPVAGLWIEICLLQIGLSFGLPAQVLIMSVERATMGSPFLLTMPQEPVVLRWSACLWFKRHF